MTQISTILKDLKDAERMVPIMSSFSSPAWLLQKQDNSWRMKGDYYKFKQVSPLQLLARWSLFGGAD